MADPSNIELKEMAQIALENWLFDEDTDPNGETKKGLEFLISDGDWDQEVIDARLDDLSRGQDKWDALEEWAKFLGS